MARDSFLSIERSFPSHAKTRKFCRLMGSATAFAHLISLWTWAMDEAPSGDLSGIYIPEIEAAAIYPTGDGKCYGAMVDAGFIDEGPGGVRQLHNWMKPGRTGYALEQLEAKRDRWRRSKGIPRGIHAEQTENLPGINADSGAVPPPSRFTVHGSRFTEDQKPEASQRADPLTPPADPPEPPILVFPCSGEPDSWPLTRKFLDAAANAYRQVYVLAEFTKAHAKITVGAVPKKTARGMPRFLMLWIGRTNDNQRGQPFAQSARGSPNISRSSGNIDELAEWLASKKAKT